MLIPFTYNLDPHTRLRPAAGHGGGHHLLGFHHRGTVRRARSRRSGSDRDRRACDGAQRRGRPRVRRRLRRLAGRRPGRRGWCSVSAFRFCGRCCSSIGSPELLAFTLFGLSMVATLSGRAPLKGLTAAGLGLMVSMIGSRSRERHAALDLRYALSLRRRAVGAGDARSVRPSRTVRTGGCCASASPASMPRPSRCRANGKACATWPRTGGWCCAAASSAPASARFPASARR